MTESLTKIDKDQRSALTSSSVGMEIGFWAAVFTTAFSAAFFIVGIFGTPYTAIGQYPYIPSTINPIDYLWLYPAFFLAPTICVLLVCVQQIAPNPKKIFGQIGLTFALMYAVLITGLYFTQWTVVLPSILDKQTEAISLFTQYNPHGFFVALESLAYLLLNTALLAIVPIFSEEKRIEAALRWLFVVSFVATVGAFVGLSLLHYNIVVFEVTIIAIDCLVLSASGILLSFMFKLDRRHSRLI